MEVLVPILLAGFVAGLLALTGPRGLLLGAALVLATIAVRLTFFPDNKELGEAALIGTPIAVIVGALVAALARPRRRKSQKRRRP